MTESHRNGPDGLPVPVRVDSRTGIWSVDSFPMILLPRHYWAAVMEEVETRMGVEAAAEIYHDATYRAAVTWCEEEAKTHSLSGVEVFHHYMARMSDRGWGKFAVERIYATPGRAVILLEHSAIALARPDAGRNVCHSFNGAFCGAMDYVASMATGSGARALEDRPGCERTPSVVSREVECAANGAARCRFEVAPSERVAPG